MPGEAWPWIGWNPGRAHELMLRLGYEQYVSQGGDWGAIISQLLAVQGPEGLLGIHANMPGTVPPDVLRHLRFRSVSPQLGRRLMTAPRLHWRVGVRGRRGRVAFTDEGAGQAAQGRGPVPDNRRGRRAAEGRTSRQVPGNARLPQREKPRHPE